MKVLLAVGIVTLSGCTFFGTHADREIEILNVMSIEPNFIQAGDEVKLVVTMPHDQDSLELSDFTVCVMDSGGAMAEITPTNFLHDVGSVMWTDGSTASISTIVFETPDNAVSGEGVILSPWDPTTFFLQVGETYSYSYGNGSQ